MNNQIIPYSLRLKPGLRRKLQAKADQSDRSLQREIIRRLEESLEIENAPESEGSEALISKTPVSNKESDNDLS